MPITAPTTAAINSSQGFTARALPARKFTTYRGSAKKASPNPYTGLPVRQRGKVLA